MNKLLLAVAIVLCSSATLLAQNFESRVPANAVAVMRYTGESFSKTLPVTKLDSYNFVKEHLFKGLKIDSLTSLNNIGINFEKDTYQYLTIGDSTYNFVTMINLKNLPQFLQLLQANYHAEMKPEKRNGYEFLGISPTTYVGWNQQQAVFVMSSLKKKPNYYDYLYNNNSDSVVAVPLIDSAIVSVDTVAYAEEEPAPPPPPVKKPIQKGKKKVATGAKGKKGTVAKKAPGKKKAPAKKPAPEPVEEVPVVEDAAVEEYKLSYDDSVAEAKREAWYAEQEKLANATQARIADSVINVSYNGTYADITTDEGYKKLVAPAANVTVWMNYETILSQYWGFILRDFYRKGLGLAAAQTPDKNAPGFRSAMNIYFEKDQMRIDQKMWSPDDKMTALGKEIYNSKQSNSLAAYVNPDHIGFMSMSINSEAMANYYYTLIRQYMKNYPYVGEYADIVDVYMDLIEIVVDEKAIAEIMPGNMMFVMHDMKTKEVTYTDYVYDENDFKSKEVTKTKKELSPNFTFAMETKREDFMKKLANLPVKYAEKGKYNYQDKGGYYELAFDKDKFAINSLYFMVKEGKVIVTTNKPSIDMTLNNTAYPLDAATKNTILNNNVALNLDTKKMIQQINGELNTDLSKKISKYLEENMGNVKMTGGMKDGMMQGTTTMAITGTHTNSLEFFFNMIDAINNIMEQDKIDRDKKVD